MFASLHYITLSKIYILIVKYWINAIYEFSLLVSATNVNSKRFKEKIQNDRGYLHSIQFVSLSLH